MSERQLLNTLIKLFNSLPNACTNQAGDCIYVDKPFTLNEEISTVLLELLEKFPNIAERSTFEIDFGEECINQEKVSSNRGRQVKKLKIPFPKRKGIPPVYFYNNAYELVEAHATLLSKGNGFPKSFYLTESNYNSYENNDPKILKVERILEWFNLLSNIANISTPKDEYIDLVFIEKAGDEKLTKPVHFATRIESRMLDIVDVPAIGHFSELLKDSEDSAIYKNEKQKFLRVALIELLRNLKFHNPTEHKSFLLAGSFDSLRNSYYEHLELFMEDFAISEFKREIEEAHFAYLEKIESVLGNIQGKLYAIPAAFIVSGAIARATTLESNLLIVFGALLTSLFTFLMISNQKHRAEYISKSIDFVFDKIERKNNDDVTDESIASNIYKAKRSLVTMLKSKKMQMTFYSICSWLPFIAASLIAYIRHNEVMHEVIARISVSICNWFFQLFN